MNVCVSGSPSGDLATQRRKKHYLHPGQIAVFSEPTVITTILGSCVAVCLWDPRCQVGGMNHYLLPGEPGAAKAPLRYGQFAIRALVDRLEGLGATCERLEAKVFGGASLHGHNSLGAANVATALAELARLGISLQAQDSGGDRGRKLLFQTDDGTVWLKRLGDAVTTPDKE